VGGIVDASSDFFVDAALLVCVLTLAFSGVSECTDNTQSFEIGKLDNSCLIKGLVIRVESVFNVGDSLKMLFIQFSVVHVNVMVAHRNRNWFVIDCLRQSAVIVLDDRIVLPFFDCSQIVAYQ